MTKDFRSKNGYACVLEREYLPSFYKALRADRWEFAQGSSLLVLYAQTRAHIDAALLLNDRVYGVDHKFIRYNAGRPNSRNVTLETLQNSREGIPGWTLTTQADYILFAFEYAPGIKRLEVYLVPWRKLKVWMKKYSRYYPLHIDHTSPNIPEFRLVPIAHITRAIPETGHYIICQDNQGGYSCLPAGRASVTTAEVA